MLNVVVNVFTFKSKDNRRRGMLQVRFRAGVNLTPERT